MILKVGGRKMKRRAGILGKVKIILYRVRICKEVDDDDKENEEECDVGRLSRR
jgi:hypothetical protein